MRYLAGKGEGREIQKGELRMFEKVIRKHVIPYLFKIHMCG